jgi:hypothetical protein
MASIVFAVKPAALSQMQVELLSVALVDIDKAINPCMTDRMLRAFKLQSIGDLLSPVKASVAVASNLSADGRGMSANLFCNARQGHVRSQSGFNLVTLALIQLPVRCSHLRLNPLV